jgi:hypothetical protein
MLRFVRVYSPAFSGIPEIFRQLHATHTRHERPIPQSVTRRPASTPGIGVTAFQWRGIPCQLGAATLPALTVPALAVPATSGCTLPSDLIERFLRVRAWFLEKHAQESLHSAEVDRRFYEASGITRAEYFDMAADDPRREELNALNIKVSKQDDREEVDEYGQTEADRLCDERWDVAEAPCLTRHRQGCRTGRRGQTVAKLPELLRKL